MVNYVTKEYIKIQPKWRFLQRVHAQQIPEPIFWGGNACGKTFGNIVLVGTTSKFMDLGVIIDSGWFGDGSGSLGGICKMENDAAAAVYAGMTPGTRVACGCCSQGRPCQNPQEPPQSDCSEKVKWLLQPGAKIQKYPIVSHIPKYPIYPNVCHTSHDPVWFDLGGVGGSPEHETTISSWVSKKSLSCHCWNLLMSMSSLLMWANSNSFSLSVVTVDPGFVFARSLCFLGPVPAKVWIFWVLDSESRFFNVFVFFIQKLTFLLHIWTPGPI